MSTEKAKKGLNISTKSFITAIVVLFLLMVEVFCPADQLRLP